MMARFQQSCIVVSGMEAFSFLQGQLTCDLKGLKPLQSIWGAHCNIKGRVEAIYEISCNEAGTFFLLTPAPVAAHALAHLQYYARFSKVTFLLESEAQPVASLAAEAALLGMDADAMGKLDLLSVEERLSKLPNAPSEHATQAGDIYGQGLAALKAGKAQLHPETVGLFLPQEMGLLERGMVSFTKGCYLGQEVISRLHYLGQLKKKLIYVETEKNACPGAWIQFDSREGCVVDSLGQAALLWI